MIPEEEKFLDESGYTLDIPEEKWPKSEAEWNELYAQERKLITEIRQNMATPFMNMELDEVLELIRSKNLEKTIIEWAYIHRKIRSIMRKENRVIFVSPQSQLLLRASNLLKD